MKSIILNLDNFVKSLIWKKYLIDKIIFCQIHISYWASIIQSWELIARAYRLNLLSILFLNSESSRRKLQQFPAKLKWDFLFAWRFDCEIPRCIRKSPLAIAWMSKSSSNAFSSVSLKWVRSCPASNWRNLPKIFPISFMLLCDHEPDILVKICSFLSYEDITKLI